MFPSIRNRRLARVPLKKHCSIASAAFLTDELIVEIITWLPVKYLIQFKCVSKFYKTRISDPYFVQMHLEKSARNPHLALMWQDDLIAVHSSNGALLVHAMDYYAWLILSALIIFIISIFGTQRLEPNLEIFLSICVGILSSLLVMILWVKLRR